MQRSYWYARGEYEYDESSADADASNAMCVDTADVNCTTPNPRGPSTLEMPLTRKNWIDYEVNDERGWPKVSSQPKKKNLCFLTHY